MKRKEAQHFELFNKLPGGILVGKCLHIAEDKLLKMP